MRTRHHHPAGSGATTHEGPSPYLIGAAIGLLNVFAFAAFRKGIGVSGAYESSAALVARHVAPDAARVNDYVKARKEPPKFNSESWLDRYNYPEAYRRARITGMLGGRAAEEVVYGTRTTGAESDIEQATGLARSMVTRWGMSDKLGMVQLATRQNTYLGGGGAGFGAERPFGEDTARMIDSEVHRIIDECHQQALRLLRLHRAPLDALAQALLARETLDENEILEVTRLPPAPALPGRPLTLITEGEPVSEG